MTGVVPGWNEEREFPVEGTHNDVNIITYIKVIDFLNEVLMYSDLIIYG